MKNIKNIKKKESRSVLTKKEQEHYKMERLQEQMRLHLNMNLFL